MAGNYTAIVLVGAFLLGVAYRGRSCPRAWQPYSAAAVLAIGTGYRPDIGTLWLAVFLIILWQHRWKRAIAAGGLFTILNLAWLAAMLHDAGGWSNYRAVSAEYAYECGYLNSVWHLGFIDATVRYSVKLAMSLVWTLGPALLFVPVGLIRIRRLENGVFLAVLMAVAAIPALGSHLLVQFGSPGWCFHYVPALIALAALGAGRVGIEESGTRIIVDGILRSASRERSGPTGRRGGRTGGDVLVLSDGLRSTGLARRLRPVVLPVHADRAQDADPAPFSTVLANRQFSPSRGNSVPECSRETGRGGLTLARLERRSAPGRGLRLGLRRGGGPARRSRRAGGRPLAIRPGGRRDPASIPPTEGSGGRPSIPRGAGSPNRRSVPASSGTDDPTINASVRRRGPVICTRSGPVSPRTLTLMVVTYSFLIT